MKKLTDAQIQHWSNISIGNSELSSHIISMATEVKQSRIDIAELKDEIEEYSYLTNRLFQILNDVANIVHGGSLTNGLHSFHDLPELVAKEQDICERLAIALGIQHMNEAYDLELQKAVKEETLIEYHNHREKMGAAE